MRFSESERALLDQPAFAQLATVMPDGAPQNTPIWYRRDGDTLRMACRDTARKARNIMRDPRVAVVVVDPANPYAFVQVMGRAEIVANDALAREEFRILAQRYMGTDGDAWFAALPAEARFVVLLIRPERTSTA
jgi:PPOX class probable F420-dependent enzyme